MATNTAGSTARDYPQGLVHYLAKAIDYTMDGTDVTLGYIPAGSAVIRGGVVVSTAFNAGTTNVLDIGTAADADGFATDLALVTIGVIVADEMATTNDAYVTADTAIQCSVDLTGTAASAGAGIVWVEYIKVV